MEQQDLLYEDQLGHKFYLNGLARQCPKCNVIAHYPVKTREPIEIECVECGYLFLVKKYSKGQRPKCHQVKNRVQR